MCRQAGRHAGIFSEFSIIECGFTLSISGEFSIAECETGYHIGEFTKGSVCGNLLISGESSIVKCVAG